MPETTVRAIVLRASDYRDYDRILTLFAYDMGKMTAAARACRRIKSPLLNAASVFTSGEYVLTQRQGRYTVKNCHIIQAHYPLRLDPVRLSHAAYLAALCEEAVQPEQPADALFRLLHEALAHLCYGDYPAKNVSVAFLLRMMDEQGIGPVLDHCAYCGGELEEAGFMTGGNGAVCGACAQETVRVGKGCLAELNALREGEFRPAQGDAAGIFKLMTEYVTARMERKFKPLDMLWRLDPTVSEK